MKKEIKEKLYRVDVQVSLLAALLVFGTSLASFGICYVITYKDSIRSLTERVESIYSYIDTTLNKSSFETVNKKSDMNKTDYIEAKERLEIIKNATGVKYLYTAKENDNGELVYIVDGLSDSEDLRHPGDLIEEEIQFELRKALTGQIVIPNKIKNTTWGKMFVTYVPIHDGERIIGVVGIEFEAKHQYNTYKMLAILIPIMTIISCGLAVICSYFGFRRISNPLYKDMANVDITTNLKNRNAFDVDLNNLFAKRSTDNICFVVMDLDKLKEINDIFGHDVGDQYIKIAGKAIKESKSENIIGYRTGGDEFVLISINADEAEVKATIKEIKEKVEMGKDKIGREISISAGFAKFNPEEDEDFFCVYKRADKEMYVDKKG